MTAFNVTCVNAIWSDSVLLYDLSDRSKIFYCSEPGCANNTTSVFCGDIDRLPKDNRTIVPCRGPPKLNKVCQHEFRAYVKTTNESCEFEHEHGFLPTSECTGTSWFFRAHLQLNFKLVLTEVCVDSENNCAIWDYLVKSLTARTFLQNRFCSLFSFFPPIFFFHLLLKQHNI